MSAEVGFRGETPRDGEKERDVEFFHHWRGEGDAARSRRVLAAVSVLNGRNALSAFAYPCAVTAVIPVRGGAKPMGSVVEGQCRSRSTSSGPVSAPAPHGAAGEEKPERMILVGKDGGVCSEMSSAFAGEDDA